jgi:hypothetical protein
MLDTDINLIPSLIFPMAKMYSYCISPSCKTAPFFVWGQRRYKTDLILKRKEKKVCIFKNAVVTHFLTTKRRRRK